MWRRALGEDFIVTCQGIRIVGGGGHGMTWIDNPALVSLDVVLTPEGLVSIGADPESEVAAGRGARTLRSSDAVESHAVEVMSVELPRDGSLSTHIDAFTLTGSTYWYWADVEGDGVSVVRVGPADMTRPAGSAVEVTGASDVPRASHIARALPPFRGEITFRYGLTTSGTAGIEIYDVHGRLVAHVVRDEAMAAGWHGARWSGHDRNGRAVPSGVCFARLTVGGNTVGQARRIILGR